MGFKQKYRIYDKNFLYKMLNQVLNYIIDAFSCILSFVFSCYKEFCFNRGISNLAPFKFFFSMDSKLACQIMYDSNFSAKSKQKNSESRITA